MPNITRPTCECNPEFRDVCAELPFYRQDKGKRYCVLHYPSQEKLEAFELELQKRLEEENYNFQGVFFPSEVSFTGIAFNTDVSFRGAVFSGEAVFDEVMFNGAVRFLETEFKGPTIFDGATFNGEAGFYRATFQKAVRFWETIFVKTAIFNGATFDEKAMFYRVSFTAEVDFVNLTFSALYFRDSVFKGSAAFHNLKPGRESQWLEFCFSRFEKPEAVTFHTAHLSPAWFVDADDCRKFRFQDIEWLDLNKEEYRKKELKSLIKRYVTSSPLALSRVCRNLAINAEESHSYTDASRFRYWAMNFARLGRKQGWKFWKRMWWKEKGTAFLDICYLIASGYGERIGRAFGVLVALWLLFAGWYMSVNFTPSNLVSHSPPTMTAIKLDTITTKPNLDLGESLLYSAGVLTLQKPEPKPIGFSTQLLVTLESILGPIQIALLALAIRRKFMR